MTLTSKNRIESIDILRGIVMVIMTLDHVRDYFHSAAFTDDPMNLATTTPLLYFTRWITHFCAPAFVFLSGTSIYLQSLRKTKKELSSFLITRGLWLVFAELTIISFAWTFNPTMKYSNLQVIWAIGISMIILGLLIRLPFKFILTLGLVVVFGHNLLDMLEAAPGFKAGIVWDLMHHGFFSDYRITPDYTVTIVYSFVPWTGLMILGYCLGVFFTPKYSSGQRMKILTRLGFSSIALFVIIRAINLYGDPHNWQIQKNTFLTILSFLNVNKYPPSLSYMCVTIGTALIALTLLENVKTRFTDIMRTFGRVAFFFYIIHLYLIHLIAVADYFLKGHSFQDVFSAPFPLLFTIPGEGHGLSVVYLIWIAVIAALYPLCKWYDSYKSLHKEKRWLSYL